MLQRHRPFTISLILLLTLGWTAVSASACEGGGGGAELTSLTTTLSGEAKEGNEITVLEGAKVKDKATLSGKNASKATGKATYKVYSDKECKTLVTTAGEVTVSGEAIPASSEEVLEAGKTYYWQAHYSGDSNNAESTSACNEILTVKAKVSVSTKLSGEGKEGEEITVLEGAKIKDKATLSGTNSKTATGKVVYKIYSDNKCEHLVKEAGEVTLEGEAKAPASTEVELAGGTYYWQATYKGDNLHQEGVSSCGKEIANVVPAPHIERIDFNGNEEVILDHRSATTHAAVAKKVEKSEALEHSTTMKEFDGDNIEWKSPKPGEVTKNWPLAYAQAATMKLKGTRLALEPATQNLLKTKLKAGSEVVVIGETTIGGKATKFEQKITKAEAEAQMKGANPEYLELTKEVAASIALPTEVKYEQITIKWKWKIEEEGGAGPVEQPLGTSKHNLYLTYGASAGNIYFTLLAQSTAQIEKVSTTPTEAQVVSAVWKIFSGATGPPGLHAWVYHPASATGEIEQMSEAMWYYEDLETLRDLPEYAKDRAEHPALAASLGIRSAKRLLEYLTGECGGWQMAFASALETEDVSSTLIKIETKFEAGAKCTVAKECYMLVNKWEFEGLQTGEAFPWAGTKIEDSEGIEGQAVANPPSYFENHELVEVDDVLYDPSYGTSPIKGALGLEGSLGLGAEAEEIREKYKNSSIAGFCILREGNKYKCRKTSEGGIVLNFTKLKLNVEAEPEGIAEGKQAE